jgi:hypothetical protein
MMKNRVPWAAALMLPAVLLAALILTPVQTPAMAAAPLRQATTTTVPAGQATPAAGQVAPAAAKADGDPANDRTTVTIGLQSDFILDPFLVPVVGKGERAAADLQKGCNGYVGSQPNVTLNWSGQTDQATFFVYSDADPVLVIQRPDGSYVCNDDAGARTMEPLVKVQQPVTGTYKIYVGTARQAEPALGFLGISKANLDDVALARLDLSPMLRRRAQPQVQAPPRVDVSELRTDQSPIFGSTALAPGFKTVQTFAAGGGDIAAFQVQDGKLACAGFLSPTPSYSFAWKGGGSGLRLFFEALQNKDSTLAVVSPNRDVVCGMNAAADNINPVVDISAPMTGTYQVYVASMAPNTLVAGRLTITGDLKATPAALAPARQ